MALFESVRVALEALWANKLRTLLTMLGVIIGVSSVIIMIAIVQGLRRQIIGQIGGNGANLISVFYSPRSDSLHRGGRNGILMEDVSTVERRCTLIGPVSPTNSTSVQVSASGQRRQTQVIGVLAAYAQTNNLKMADGQFITDADDADWDKKCVIGSKIKDDLFGDAEAVGKEVIFAGTGGNVSLRVVGVLEERDSSFTADFNGSVFAPFHTVQKRLSGSDSISNFSVQALDVTQTDAAADQVWNVMRQRHPGNFNDFIVDTQESLLKQLDVIIGGVQVVLGGVGGLSLLTGGIGIMNIMLVSVTERTREIGIRKAVGATRGAILLQFIVEAVLVSCLGGAIGVAQGYGVAALIDKFAHKTLPAFVPLWGAVLGFSFAVGVGLFFGIYPAYRAAKLDPITALRYE
jgi:putative ABC transport system permease protein